jgi:hypothetical protein
MLNHMAHHLMCKILNFCFEFHYIYMSVWDFWKHFQLMKITCYKIEKFYKFVKGIERLIFKGFNIVCECTKSMVGR